MNSGGSRKTISSAYGNVSGTRKQIYPYNATTTYTWNRYNLKSTYRLWFENDYESDVDQELFRDEYMNENSVQYGSTFYYSTTGYTYNSSNCTLTLTDYKSCSRPAYNQSAFRNRTVWFFDAVPLSTTSTEWTMGKLYTADLKAAGKFNQEAGIGMRIFKVSTGNDWYMATVIQRDIAHAEKTDGKGTANGTVTSNSRNSYPDNGISGNYWYVFVS